jgi:hypothetical protein
VKTLTASDRSALIKLASSLDKGSQERKVILAGLKKSAGVYISSKVEPTPVMLQAIKVMEKLFPYGLRLEKRGSKVELSTYREGYLAKTIPGRWVSNWSVGGDHNFPYQETPDSVVKLRAFVSVTAIFHEDGKVEVELRQPKLPLEGRDYAEGEDTTLFKGRVFKGPATRAVKKARAAFDMWGAKFV